MSKRSNWILIALLVLTPAALMRAADDTVDAGDSQRLSSISQSYEAPRVIHVLPLVFDAPDQSAQVEVNADIVATGASFDGTVIHASALHDTMTLTTAEHVTSAADTSAAPAAFHEAHASHDDRSHHRPRSVILAPIPPQSTLHPEQNLDRFPTHYPVTQQVHNGADPRFRGTLSYRQTYLPTRGVVYTSPYGYHTRPYYYPVTAYRYPRHYGHIGYGHHGYGHYGYGHHRGHIGGHFGYGHHYGHHSGFNISIRINID